MDKLYGSRSEQSRKQGLKLKVGDAIGNSTGLNFSISPDCFLSTRSARISLCLEINPRSGQQADRSNVSINEIQIG